MKTPSPTAFTISALTLFCFALGASAMPISNIVKNGNFETGGIPPWQLGGNTGNPGARSSAVNNGAFGVDQDSAHTGNFGLFAHPEGSLGFLRQRLDTVAGATYELSFWLDAIQNEALATSSGTHHPVKFVVYWNGSLIYKSFTPPNEYTQFTFTDLLATKAHTNLRFGFRDDFGEFHLDDVIAGIPQVPEPFSTLWLALPLVLLFGAAKKKRAKFAAIS